MYFNAPITDPLHAAFERWLGRQLTERQRYVICLLEKLRRSHCEEPRLLIHDDGSTPEEQIPELIADYFRWLHYRSRQDMLPPSLVIGRTHAIADRLAGFGRGRFHSGTLRAISNWRGVEFANLLVAEADRVPSPYYRDPYTGEECVRSIHQYLQIRCVAQGCNPHSVVVIHGNARRWSTQFHFNFFDTATDGSTRYLAIALHPLPKYLIRRHSLHLKHFKPGCNPFIDMVKEVKTPRKQKAAKAEKPKRRRTERRRITRYYMVIAHPITTPLRESSQWWRKRAEESIVETSAAVDFRDMVRSPFPRSAPFNGADVGVFGGMTMQLKSSA